MADTIDPLGGAYAIEALTDEIEARVKEELARIDALGGALRAIERGYQQERIEDSAYRYQRAVESGERIVVGVNAFRSEVPDPAPALLTVDERLADEQRARLVAHRASRDASAVATTRAALVLAARGTGDLMAPVLAAVEAGVTLGEICADLRGVFGTYEPRRG